MGWLMRQGQSSSVTRSDLGREAGVTMIEIAVVIALIAFLYSIAIPQFSLRSGTEAATKVQRVADDIRGAFDLAVLNNRTYRLSFVFSTGEYWLEEADREVTVLGDGKGGKDPSESEESARDDEFNAQTKEFESLAGEPIRDEDGEILVGANDSPVLKNRKAAQGPKWSRVDALEWQDRSVGPYLMVSEMQAEHHGQKQVLGDVGETGRAFIYFFPTGYVERAFITIAFKKDTMLVDDEQKPYTIITRPFLGTAEVVSGAAEIDVHDTKEES